MTNPAPINPVPGEEHRLAFRKKHQVRLVTEEEEGFGVHRLPNGVYGYTFAPGLDKAPLFRAHKYQSFEAHKLADGTVVLIGFVTSEAAKRIETFEPAKLRLRPEPGEDAVVAVAVPLWRIQRHKEYSTRDGKGLEIELIGGKT